MHTTTIFQMFRCVDSDTYTCMLCINELNMLTCKYDCVCMFKRSFPLSQSLGKVCTRKHTYTHTYVHLRKQYV